MRKLIVTEFITLDGVIEAPGGDETDHPHGGWQRNYAAPEVRDFKVKELQDTDALLLGRKTYDQFAGYWPKQSGDPFSDRMNSLPKYVVSTSLNNAEWNNAHILRDVAKDVSNLKNEGNGAMLVYGSGTLAKSLLHHNLVDELRLIMYPVVIGGGIKLFNDNRELQAFSLQQWQVLSNGVIILEYTLD